MYVGSLHMKTEQKLHELSCQKKINTTIVIDYMKHVLVLNLDLIV